MSSTPAAGGLVGDFTAVVVLVELVKANCVSSDDTAVAAIDDLVLSVRPRSDFDG